MILAAQITCAVLIAIAVLACIKGPTRNRRIYRRDTLPPPSPNCQRNGVECAGKV